MNEQSPQIESSETDAANEIIHKQQFGVLLREERERQNYTILEVAEYLHLSEGHIKALENSRIDELPGKTFTLGYIRSYTRLLNIGDELIIATYLEHYDEGEAPLKNNSKAATQTAKYNPTLMLLAAALILLVIGLTIWLQKDEPVEPSGSSNTDEALMLQPDENAQLKEKSLPAENKKSQAEPVPVSKAAAVAVEKTAPVKAQEKQTPATDGDLLQIHAKEASWAKIQDAEGKRLFYATLKAGENYQFNGKAPFNIFLGNAPAVQLSVNHQDVDLKGHIKSNNVAQISVDETASIQ